MARVAFRLVALLLTALAPVVLPECLTVTAQPAGKVFRIGVLSPGSAQGSSVEMAALQTGLREVGYVESQNIRLDWQFGRGPRRAAARARGRTRPSQA